MKKLFVLMLALVLALGAMGACAETMPGGWSVNETIDMTDEAKAVFDKALEGLVGVNYEPLAYLGKQIVSGTNHCFLCRATVVYPNAVPELALVYVYEDAQGNCSITFITTLDLAASSGTAME